MYLVISWMRKCKPRNKHKKNPFQSCNRNETAKTSENFNVIDMIVVNRNLKPCHRVYCVTIMNSEKFNSHYCTQNVYVNVNYGKNSLGVLLSQSNHESACEVRPQQWIYPC